MKRPTLYSLKRTSNDGCCWKRNVSQTKLNCQRVFVWLLDQPVPKRVKNLYGAADYLKNFFFGQELSAVRVHSCSLVVNHASCGSIVAVIDRIDSAHRFLASLLFDYVRHEPRRSRDHENAVERGGVHS